METINLVVNVSSRGVWYSFDVDKQMKFWTYLPEGFIRDKGLNPAISVKELMDIGPGIHRISRETRLSKKNMPI